MKKTTDFYKSPSGRRFRPSPFLLHNYRQYYSFARMPPTIANLKYDIDIKTPGHERYPVCNQHHTDSSSKRFDCKNLISNPDLSSYRLFST